MNTITDRAQEATETALRDTDTSATDDGRFHIASDTAANWLLQKLGNIEAEKTRVKAQAEAIVKQLEADAEGLRFLYAGELESYVRAKVAQNGGRRKTIHFLQGSASFRTIPATVKVADVTAAIEWARVEVPNLVRTVETLDATGYQKRAQALLQETGELLPGSSWTPARESFSVRFGKGGKEE